ncbi:MAG: DUF2585 family protein [Planctomycetota bacterium]|nr:MAG: DUF2585 family protein [Planctomycetota bacterium]
MQLFTRRTAPVALALVALCGMVLYFEGRIGWCKYGFSLWSPAWSRCTSQNLFDPYTFSHLLHGVIFYWLLRWLAPNWPLAWRLIAAMTIEVAWELLENSPPIIERYRQTTASLDYTGDSILNSLSDVAAAVAGFAIASRTGWKTALAMFAGLELLALLIARDNLTLNVLMLIWPIESIKDWQTM